MAGRKQSKTEARPAAASAPTKTKLKAKAVTSAPAQARSKAKKPAKAEPVRRRTAGGKLEPKYAAGLLARSGINQVDEDARAFLDRPCSEDPIVEDLGEGFLQSATTGEDSDELVPGPNEPDEEGNSFVETSAEDEFAYGTDESNPEDAEPAPFPTTQSTTTSYGGIGS
jgi:hypothetical protein